ncbi:SDN5 [Symbiodinium sp. CCMP2592]|nr:SDN5 [Symbiodinium sp. CCMP2592]
MCYSFSPPQPQELLSQQSILVGHSLESDLKALQLFHERVIDTVLLYPHPRGWPCRQSLAGLCSAVLKRKLQREGGHDSIQDAKVALELALLKFARGPSFGATGGESVPLGRLLKETGVQLLISEADGADSSRASSWYEESCRRALLSELGADLKPAEDEEAESLSRRSVHIVVLRSFERFCETAHALSGGSLEDGLPDCLARIDRQAARAAEGLTENDLLIMLNGCGNFQFLRKLMDAKCETATAPADEKRKVARARDRFKDTWGVFQCGGAALEQLLKAPPCVEAPPIQRELAPSQQKASFSEVRESESRLETCESTQASKLLVPTATVKKCLPVELGAFISSILAFMMGGILGLPMQMQTFLNGGFMEVMVDCISFTRWSVSMSFLEYLALHPPDEAKLDTINSELLKLFRDHAYTKATFILDIRDGQWWTGVLALLLQGV